MSGAHPRTRTRIVSYAGNGRYILSIRILQRSWRDRGSVGKLKEAQGKHGQPGRGLGCYFHRPLRPREGTRTQIYLAAALSVLVEADVTYMDTPPAYHQKH